MGSLLTANAQYIAKQGQIDANRIAQKGANERRAAESDLQRFNQNLANKKILEAAGKNYNTATENIGRNLDAATYGDFMTSMAASEELGAASAMAAAAGIGGSSVEAYNATIERSNAVQQELSDRNLRTDLYNAYDARGRILTDAVGSFDNNIYRADIDVRKWADARKPSTFGTILTLGLAAGATYFGGPQAGQAVLAAGSAIQQANSGDFDGAARSFDTALGAGIGAVQTNAKLGTGGSGGSTYWSSVKKKNTNAKGISW